MELAVTEGSLALRSVTLPEGKSGPVSVTLNGRRIAHRAEGQAGAVTLTLTLEGEVVVAAGGKIVVVLA
jgi:hypothetical protein